LLSNGKKGLKGTEDFLVEGVEGNTGISKNEKGKYVIHAT
jgi:hypothetical protein